MPKSDFQKLKLLYIKDYLQHNSDLQHSISTNDIIRYLEGLDIKAERKAVYNDLEMLGPDYYGMDILRDRNGARLLSRDFELQEVKLLVDMVQSSNFITRKKTEELISKLSSLVSDYEGKLLKRQVFVRNRIKNMNESVYLFVDAISDAINNDGRISFKYTHYNLRRKKDTAKGKKYSGVSPFALLWIDQNYYLLAYCTGEDSLRHFRVDRMSEVEEIPGPREGKKLYRECDMSTYTTKVFNMFGGNPARVKLRCKNHMVDAVIDRFGTDIAIIPVDEERFEVSLDVVVSTQFFAWLFGFSDSVEILSPEEVRLQMKEQLSRVLENYNY